MPKRGLTRGKTWIVKNSVAFTDMKTVVGGARWVNYENGWAHYVVRVPEGYEGQPARLVAAAVPRGMFFLSAEYRLVDKPHRVRWIAQHKERVRDELGGVCPSGGIELDPDAPPQFAPYPQCDLCASHILWEAPATDFPGHWSYR